MAKMIKENGECIPDIFNVIFMIDTSGCMMGDKIDTVNDLMRELPLELQKDMKLHYIHDYFELRFSALAFGSAAKWNTAPPKPLNEFKWIDLSADGLTSFGKACKEVEQKLHGDSDFFKEMRNFKEPLVILFSDGLANDDGQDNFDKLKNNSHFKRGTPIAIDLAGIESKGEAVLKDFATGGTYIKIEDIGKLKIVIFSAICTLMKTSLMGFSTSKQHEESMHKCVAESLCNILGVHAESIPNSKTRLEKLNMSANETITVDCTNIDINTNQPKVWSEYV